MHIVISRPHTWTRNSHTLLLTDLSGLPTPRQFVFAGQQKETCSSLKAPSPPGNKAKTCVCRLETVSRQWTLQTNLTVTVSADWILVSYYKFWQSVTYLVQISRIFRRGLTQLRLLTLSGLQTTQYMYWTTGRQLSQALNVLLVKIYKTLPGSASDRKVHGLPRTVLLNKVRRKFTLCEWMEFWEGILHWLQGVESLGESWRGRESS